MAKDPVCGMTVDESTALRADRDGSSFFFCSEHCRSKFLGLSLSEKSILTAAGDGSELSHRPHAHHRRQTADATAPVTAKYLCPMCQGVQSDEPGDCPKCGMALERNRLDPFCCG